MLFLQACASASGGVWVSHHNEEIDLTSTWIAYNDLAWTEDWLADPAEYEHEVMVYVDLIKNNSVEFEPIFRSDLFAPKSQNLTKRD